MASVWSITILLGVISLFFGGVFSDILMVLVCANFFYGLYRLINYYKSYKNALKIIPYLQNTPNASEELIDCYVKCRGILLNSNALHSPVSNQICNAFYIKQLGLWQTKRKKPQKGMATEKKQLATQVSTEALLIKTQHGIITIEPQQFLPNALIMPEAKSSFVEAPLSITEVGKLHKYRKYEIIALMTKQQDEVLLLGKLTRKNEHLLLTPTFSKYHPTVFCLGNFSLLKDFVNENTLNTYQYIHFKSYTPLVLNVIILIYLLSKQIA